MSAFVNPRARRLALEMALLEWFYTLVWFQWNIWQRVRRVRHLCGAPRHLLFATLVSESAARAIRYRSRVGAVGSTQGSRPSAGTMNLPIFQVGTQKEEICDEDRQLEERNGRERQIDWSGSNEYRHKTVRPCRESSPTGVSGRWCDCSCICDSLRLRACTTVLREGSKKGTNPFEPCSLGVCAWSHGGGGDIAWEIWRESAGICQAEGRWIGGNRKGAGHERTIIGGSRHDSRYEGVVWAGASSECDGGFVGCGCDKGIQMEPDCL